LREELPFSWRARVTALVVEAFLVDLDSSNCWEGTAWSSTSASPSTTLYGGAAFFGVPSTITSISSGFSTADLNLAFMLDGF
jgi:hypothetical protein